MFFNLKAFKDILQHFKFVNSWFRFFECIDLSNNKELTKFVCHRKFINSESFVVYYFSRPLKKSTLYFLRVECYICTTDTRKFPVNSNGRMERLMCNFHYLGYYCSPNLSIHQNSTQEPTWNFLVTLICTSVHIWKNEIMKK